MTRIIMVLLLFLSTPALPQDANVTDQDRFELWYNCQPMNLFVSPLDEDDKEYGISEDDIVVAVRSRLRAARLYEANVDSHAFLHLYVETVGLAFQINITYRKPLKDEASGLRGFATTWEYSITGTHGRDAQYILNMVTRNADRFIDEYLRVNADACS